MLMPDVNILIGVWHTDAAEHSRLTDWLSEAISDGRQIWLSSLVMAGVVRIATNPRIFVRPMPLSDVLDNFRMLLDSGSAIMAHPGPRHMELFTALCLQANAQGNLVTDARHAAIAIENDATWVSLDKDFARFPGLVWQTPQ